MKFVQNAPGQNQKIEIMTEPIEPTDDETEVGHPFWRVIRPPADAEPYDFLIYEIELINIAKKWAVTVCDAISGLFNATADDQPEEIRTAVQHLYGGGVGATYVDMAWAAWTDARHLIDPIGMPARLFPSIPPSRFDGPPLLVPTASSAHEAVIRAPDELLMNLLMLHHKAGVLTSAELVPTREDGRRHIPVRLSEVFCERCDTDLIQQALGDFRDEHFRRLAVSVKAESQTAIQFARESFFRSQRSDEEYRPPLPAMTHHRAPWRSRDYAEGADGPIDGTTIFRYLGTLFHMPEGKAAQLINFLWRLPEQEAGFSELEAEGIWLAGKATEGAVKTAIARANNFFGSPSPEDPSSRIPYRLAKVEKVDRVRLQPGSEAD